LTHGSAHSLCELTTTAQRRHKKMLANPQEILDRFGKILARTLGSTNSGNGNSTTTVGDIYYELVPFQACQKELGFQSIMDYERALLRLLAGYGGVLEMESLADKQKLEQHVNSYRVDPFVLRDFFSSGVRVLPSDLHR
jgi:hypothetical protein